MAKPIAARTLKVMDYLRKYPDKPVFEVAGKFGMALSHVYKLRKRVKEEGKEDKAPAAPKRLYVPHAAAMIAEKLGIPLEEYVKRMREQDPTAFEETNDLMPDEDDDTPSVDDILDERGDRYGTFESNAKTCQLLKNVLHAQDGWYRLSYVQREAVEMIMHKISRLVNGDGTYLDTVVDISGYNQLMLDHMRGKNEDKKME